MQRILSHHSRSLAAIDSIPSALPAFIKQFSTDDGPVIQIDRSGLRKLQSDPNHTHGGDTADHKEPETPMAKHIKSIIRFRGGPITLAEYMSEALTNPSAGYYTQRDVFGVSGDFVTSPEISQMFGEMIGIWCVAMWQQLGQPETLRIVELGPGRGTLMADLLRGTAPFKGFASAIKLSMVEVSPVLRRMQFKALKCVGASNTNNPEEILTGTSGWYDAPTQVEWHRSLDEVPNDCTTLYIAHEFFDALPVHQFQKTSDRGWCERLVDLASPDSPLHLRLVLSPGKTPATTTVLPRRLDGMSMEERKDARAVEISPQSMALAQSLAQRVTATGGAALVIDYGKDGYYQHSLQGIKDHKFVGLLESPGMADLSAHVDFDALRFAVQGSGADWYGPITQSQLLIGLGIEARLQQLMQTASEEEAKGLMAGFQRIVGSGQITFDDTDAQQPKLHLPPSTQQHQKNKAINKGSSSSTQEGMGTIYKAACIVPAGAPPPVVFPVPSSS